MLNAVKGSASTIVHGSSNSRCPTFTGNFLDIRSLNNVPELGLDSRCLVGRKVPIDKVFDATIVMEYVCRGRGCRNLILQPSLGDVPRPANQLHARTPILYNIYWPLVSLQCHAIGCPRLRPMCLPCKWEMDRSPI